MKTRGPDTRELVQAFLVLLAGAEATLLVIAALASAKLTSPETLVTLFASASALATLGLFMTWGDPGNRTRNAAKSLFVLCVLVGGVVALLSWAAATASKGS